VNISSEHEQEQEQEHKQNNSDNNNSSSSTNSNSNKKKKNKSNSSKLSATSILNKLVLSNKLPAISHPSMSTMPSESAKSTSAERFRTLSKTDFLTASQDIKVELEIKNPKKCNAFGLDFHIEY
jgi:hypothetical protein